MHKAAATRSERIDIRTNREAKSIIERAAQLRHVSISAYLMDSALQKAKEDLRDTETFILDDTDRDIFFAALSSPTAPNDALRKLFTERPRE